MKKIHKNPDYSRDLNLQMKLPFQFILLCRLMQVTPREMLYDFMCNVGQESYSKQGDEARLKASEYFLLCGYGQNFYTPEDIKKVFKELDAIGSLYPCEGKMEFKDQHVDWRGAYYKYWFKKWFWKIKRKS